MVIDAACFGGPRSFSPEVEIDLPPCYTAATTPPARRGTLNAVPLENRQRPAVAWFCATLANGRAVQYHGGHADTYRVRYAFSMIGEKR